MSSPSPAFASSLFDTVANYLQQLSNGQTDQQTIENDLQTYLVPSDVATMIAQALVKGEKVELATGQSTTLGALLNPFLPSQYPVPEAWTNIPVGNLSFTCTGDVTDPSFEFDGSATIPLTLAGQSVTWSPALSVSSAVQDGSRDNDGSLISSFTLGTLDLGGEYDFSSDSQTFTADVSAASGQLSLQSLCGAFSLTMPSLWEGVSDISLTSASLQLDMSDDGTDTLQITAQYSAGSLSGDAFATVINDDGAWKLVFGGDLGTNFSNFPVIGSDLQAPLDLAAAFAIVSTDAISNFSIPVAASSPFENYPITMAAGVMIAALIDLSNPSGTCATNLANFNNPPQAANSTPASDNILVTADLTAGAATLTADLGSKTIYSYTLDLTLSIIFATTVTIQLSSSLTVSGMTFGVSIDLTAEVLLIDLSLQSSDGIQLQLSDSSYFPSNVYINSIQGVLGIDFEKFEAEAGIAAVFGFNASPSGVPSTNLVKSLLPAPTSRASGQVPAPSKWECALIAGAELETLIDIDLVLLSIDQISLADICSILCPGVSADAAQALNGISLNNILLYWCDDLPGNFAALNLTLPGYGTDLPTGFIFQGGLTWGSFSAFAGITVVSSGCSGSLSVSPISIGSILSISGAGIDQTGVTTNGPIVTFNTSGSPAYLYANWEVKLLDVPLAGATTVQVTSTELDFSIDAKIGSLASGSFDCQLDPAQGWFNFQCSGTFDDSHYSVPIASGVYNQNISLEGSSFSASFSVTVDNDNVAWTVDATLQYLGLSLSVPGFKGDFALGTVDDVLKGVWHAILANVDSVFANVLNDIQALGKDIGKLFNDVVKDIQRFVDWLSGHPSKPGYLQNNAILISDAGDVYFEVESMRLRWVPDDTTLQAIDPKRKHTFSQNMDPVIAGLKQDTVMVPSRVDGTMFQLQDGGKWFLIASGYRGGTSGPTVPSLYVIQNADWFQARCNGPVKVAWQVNQYGGGNQSAFGDMFFIPYNDPLKDLTDGTGAIQSDAPQGSANHGSISLFIDGIRYHFGGNLWSGSSLVTWPGKSTAVVTIPDIAYSAMPQYQGLGVPGNDYTIDIQQGSLYKSDQQTAIYYASMGSDGLIRGLYWINLNQWASIWKMAAPILFPDAFWQCLRVSQDTVYPGEPVGSPWTNTPPAPAQLTWVCNLGSGGNGMWPVPGLMGNTVEYGVSFVDAEGKESNVTWGSQLPITGYMCAELSIPTDSSTPSVTTARNIYRQFLLNGTPAAGGAAPALVGTINDNYTTAWSDVSPACNVAAPPQLESPNNGDWAADLPIPNSQVWQAGNIVQYAMSYVLPGGETQLSEWSAPIQVTLYAYPYFDNVPTCPTDAAGSGTILTLSPGQVITRNIYRQCSSANGSLIDPQRLVGQISDNTIIDFRDNVPTPASPPQGITGGEEYNLGTGGNGVWPAGQQGNKVQYGVSLVNGAVESTINWGSPTDITGYMGFELTIPTDDSNWGTTARNMYRQFFGSNGSSLAPPELVGRVNDNSTKNWNDVSPAWNVAAPPQLEPPNNGDWAADAPIANSQVWQPGNFVQYAMSYVLPGGETQLSEWSAPIQVTLYAYPYFDKVPTCPTDPGSGTILSAGQVITRKIYRLCKGPGGNVIQPQTPVGQISDNTIANFRDWTP